MAEWAHMHALFPTLLGAHWGTGQGVHTSRSTLSAPPPHTHTHIQAPAGDHKGSQKAMDETFSLTNISPQVGQGFNR